MCGSARLRAPQLRPGTERGPARPSCAPALPRQRPSSPRTESAQRTPLCAPRARARARRREPLSPTRAANGSGRRPEEAAPSPPPRPPLAAARGVARPAPPPSARPSRSFPAWPAATIGVRVVGEFNTRRRGRRAPQRVRARTRRDRPPAARPLARAPLLPLCLAPSTSLSLSLSLLGCAAGGPASRARLPARPRVRQRAEGRRRRGSVGAGAEAAAARPRARPSAAAMMANPPEVVALLDSSDEEVSAAGSDDDADECVIVGASAPGPEAARAGGRSTGPAVPPDSQDCVFVGATPATRALPARHPPEDLVELHSPPENFEERAKTRRLEREVKRLKRELSDKDALPAHWSKMHDGTTVSLQDLPVTIPSVNAARHGEPAPGGSGSSSSGLGAANTPLDAMALEMLIHEHGASRAVAEVRSAALPSHPTTCASLLPRELHRRSRCWRVVLITSLRRLTTRLGFHHTAAK